MLPAALVQSVKNVLDQVPGTPVRHLHNQLDAEIQRQNEERMQKEQEEQKAALRKEIESDVAND